MGTCCEPESQNTGQFAGSGNSSRNKKRKLSNKMQSSGEIDSDWYRSYSGKVHSAILNIHKAPKSFVNKLDRVYEDLIK